MAFLYPVSILTAVAFFSALFSGVFWVLESSRPPSVLGFRKRPILNTQRASAVLAASLLATLAIFGPVACLSPHLPNRATSAEALH